MPAPMTELQEQFALEYAMNGGDAKQAAIAVGHSEKSAWDPNALRSVWASAAASKP